jgi:hypothetical protein
MAGNLRSLISLDGLAGGAAAGHLLFLIKIMFLKGRLLLKFDSSLNFELSRSFFESTWKGRT